MAEAGGKKVVAMTNQERRSFRRRLLLSLQKNFDLLLLDKMKVENLVEKLARWGAELAVYVSARALGVLRSGHMDDGCLHGADKKTESR